MTQALSRHWFYLLKVLHGVWCASRKQRTGKGMLWEYQTKLGIGRANTITSSLTKLSYVYRSPEGKPWPEDVRERLDKLYSAVVKVGVSQNEQEDRERVQKALIELQNAQDTFDSHKLLVPRLLEEIRTDLERARGELSPDQSRGPDC